MNKFKVCSLLLSLVVVSCNATKEELLKSATEFVKNDRYCTGTISAAVAGVAAWRSLVAGRAAFEAYRSGDSSYNVVKIFGSNFFAKPDLDTVKTMASVAVVYNYSDSMKSAVVDNKEIIGKIAGGLFMVKIAPQGIDALLKSFPK